MGLFKFRTYTPSRDRAAEVIEIQQSVQTLTRGLSQELGRLQQIIDQIDRDAGTMGQPASQTVDPVEKKDNL